MNRLWVRLALAFGGLTLAAVLLIALLVNRETDLQFRRFVGQSGFADSPVLAELSDYYAGNGGWVGVEALLQQHGAGQGQGAGRGGGYGRGTPSFVLADAEGQVLYDRSGERTGFPLTAREREVAVPIVYQGETVGYLIAGTPARSELSEGAKGFLAQVNAALWQAGLLAAGMGALLGFLIAQQLTAPLSRLATAAHRLAQGQLGERVAAGGTEEVSEVARAFNRMAASLQQAEAVRQNMVADIAHELRTPLSVFQGGLRAILDDVYPMDKKEIAALYDESLLLGHLVNDLRDLAQAEAGHLSLALEAAELEPLLEGAVHLFAEAAHERSISLTLDCPRDLPRVRMDQSRTRQILHNLLSNALRHTPDRGEIHVRASGDDGSVRVEVTDSGSGLAEEEVEHVFERFWRAERSRSRSRGGSGLGLAIAKHLVEAQGGQIGVQSKPGQGSRFWFTVLSSSNNRGASAVVRGDDTPGSVTSGITELRSSGGES